MVRAVVGFVMLAGAVLLVAGCAPRAVAPVAAPTPAPAPPRADEIEAIVALLDRGDVAAADPRIDALLARDPADTDARVLRTSIDEDAVALLGPGSFAYTAKPGDTMRGLARRFLGNRIKFYQLARYNGIAVPASLAAGTVLRIPGVAPVRVRSPRRPSPPIARKADPAGAQRLRTMAMTELRGGRTAAAVALLRRAATLDPGDPLIRRDLDRLSPAK